MQTIEQTLTVKKIFDEECSHLKIDSHLVRRLSDFQISFCQKNEEHMTFFGGNLTGVQIVRFTTQDVQKWFTDVLQVDDVILEEKVLELPTINEDFHISSDIFNISVIWVIHSIINSHHLTESQKEQGCLDAALILHYKFLTSLLYQYFKYSAKPETAAATYAQLSYKFAIKQHGSWSATLHARCKSLLSKESIHYEAFKRFTPDVAIVYILNDTQGRIRDMMKNIYSEFLRVHKEGDRIISTSSNISFDGKEILKDKTKNLTSYTRYLQSIISDKNTFIKDELLDIITNIQYTMSPKLLMKTLNWVSSNYRGTGDSLIEDFTNMCMTHSFGYMTDHQNIIRETNNLASLIANLRGVYMSSRSTDVELLAIREKGEKIVTLATGIKNDSVIASVRTGLLLYLVLRAFTKNHYS